MPLKRGRNSRISRMVEEAKAHDGSAHPMRGGRPTVTPVGGNPALSLNDPREISAGINTNRGYGAGRRYGYVNEGLMERVLDTRRQAKLSSMDAGLSTRGRVPASGARSFGRPMKMRGLEGRGIVPAPGTRSAGRPMKMRGLEHRGTVPASGTRLVGRPMQMRGLEHRGTVPASGTRSMGRPTKIRGGTRRPTQNTPVSSATQPAASHTAASQAAASQAAARGSQNTPIASSAPAARRMSDRTRKGLMIGGAAAVAVALNNRSGKSTDRGRQSTYRY